MLFFESKVLHVAVRICLCEKCKQDDGSCSLFNIYTLHVKQWTGNTLRSQNKLTEIKSENSHDDENEGVVHEFLLPGAACAIAAGMILCGLWK